MKIIDTPLLKLLMSSGSAQALLFFGSLIMAAFFEPNAIGEYGFYITVASVFAVSSAFRLDYYAFFSKDSDKCRCLLYTCGLFFLLIAFFIIFLLCLFGFILGEKALLLAFSILSFSFFHLSLQKSLLDKDYSSYAVSRIIHGGCFLIFIFIFSKFEVIGALLSYCFGQLVACFYLIRKNPFSFELKWLSYCLSYRFKERLVNLFSTFVQLLSPALPLIIGLYYFSAQDLGVFFWLSQVFAGGATIIKRSLMGFLSAELMEDGTIRADTVKIAKMSLVLGLSLPITLSSAVYLLTKIPIDISQSWSNATFLVVPLVLLYCTDALLQPLGSLLPSIKSEKAHFLIEVLRLVFVFSSFIVSDWFGLGIVVFTWMYSLVMALFYIIGASLFCKLASNQERFNYA